MIKLVCTVYDRKAECYGPLMVFNQRGEALRSLDGAVKDTSTMISRYPEDYTMHVLGEYDDVSGRLKSLDQPEYLVCAADFAAAK